MFHCSPDQQLLDKCRYRDACNRLEAKSNSNSDYGRSSPVFKKLTLKWVQHNRELVISEILKSVKRGYEFSSSSRVVLVDAAKKSRDIYVQSWPDRIVLMVLAEILSQQTQTLVPSSVYSFRKGTGPIDALNAFSMFQKKHRGQPLTVLKRDVSKYGDSIPQQLLLDKVKRALNLGGDSRLLKLLERGLRPEFFDSESTETRQSLIVGVPSGSPIVPPLENFYLIDLDHALASFSDAFYARYGDDFIFAHHDPAVCQQADQKIEAVMAELGLIIKEEKKLNVTLAPQNSHGFDWLGARINIDGSVGFKQKKTLQMQDSLVSLVDSLIERTAAIPNDSQKLEVLRVGLREILDPQHHVLIAQLIHERRHRPTIRRFDQVFIGRVVRSLTKHWGLGRRNAWRLFRSLKLVTLTKKTFVKKRLKHVEKTAA
jgi:retron-type reverse transcriptase